MSENQNNPGFHFTDNMICFMCWIFDYIEDNSAELVTYKIFQERISSSIVHNPEKALKKLIIRPSDNVNGKWDSKVRMLFPVLRSMGVINYNDTNDKFKIRDLLTSNSEPLRLSALIYRETLLAENEKLKHLGRALFNSSLNTYLKRIVAEYSKNQKPLFITIIKYLIKYDYIDIDEFFVIVEFSKNTYVDCCSNVDDWTMKHRSNEPLSFVRPKILNPWNYSMRMLEEFEVCYEINKKFYVKNKERLMKIFGGK